jgi:hypothetical protein
MFKWVGLVFVGAIIFAIATGNLGGAKKATGNYQSIMTGGAKTAK